MSRQRLTLQNLKPGLIKQSTTRQPIISNGKTGGLNGRAVPTVAAVAVRNLNQRQKS